MYVRVTGTSVDSCFCRGKGGRTSQVHPFPTWHLAAGDAQVNKAIIGPSPSCLGGLGGFQRLSGTCFWL
jgi:hypothetical protein